ncbi:TOMM precursor leader peptide-binding protein [Streptomyces ficellus]|uniref:TOMM leader peptide-binding protein n=1 Tax=Streptomyces ficellus TaxID=1977088 RepID=A0ABT7Z7E8_9ACTN|nr:TOMM precursor leader peptide-binding protein [Streptomyces ficellus]MDN3295373.1 TOMM precursor leader peptide-binding protein [Streptomyces ficellus]
MTAPGLTGTELPVGFKRHLRVEAVVGDAVYLLSEQGTTALEGRDVQKLVTLLDGTRTLPDVMREASATLAPAQVASMIAALAKADLIGYHDPAADASTEAYWEFAGLSGPAATASLQRTTVDLVTLGRVDADAARAECLAAGLRIAGPGCAGPAALTLVLCDDYLDPRLAEVNARHRDAGRAWLLAKPCGAETWVGPVFGGASDGPCWACLAHRLRGHRASRTPVLHALGLAGTVPVPEASLVTVRALGLHTAMLEASKWVAGLRYEGQDAVCTLDTRTLRTRKHPVTRRPQCPECGDRGLVAAQVRRPFVPVSRPKADVAGSNDRAYGAETVLARYRHLADPITGVVAGVRPAPDAPEGLNRYVAGPNLAFAGGRSLAGLRGGLRSQSGGKGTTALEAEVGALCEAVERYCGTRQGDEPTVWDTLHGLGDSALHPNACQLYADRQFAGRDRWNAVNSAFQHVPPPFDPHLPTEWTPVWSLTAGRHRLLPTSMLYFGASADTGPCAPWADSNGNAAGSSLEDAVVQGFLELVERDAVALWWYNRTRHPAVDLDAFDEPWLAGTRAAYTRLRRQLWVLDLTADFGIPVMAAVSRRTDQAAEHISFGFGAHFDPRLALRRAVTEMTQLLPPEGDPPRMRALHADIRTWLLSANVQNQPYLAPDRAEAPRTPGHYTYVRRGDLREDIEAAEALVRRQGMELLILDQTRPDVGLPVVKVVIPGMRHFWARFAPGRLFDVPVRLGRLSGPTPYEDLNPIPLFV